MGLTNQQVGMNVIDSDLEIVKNSPDDIVVALAGNPNVGKSTVFNALTGMNQHTGNWPGKTVANAQGSHSTDEFDYVLVDIPGTYSLMAHSAEEEVARNFLCFGEPNLIVVVCDATCLERNLNLVLQTLEITSQVIVCVNLYDEAIKKNIHVDLDALSKELGVPVVSTVARRKNSLNKLTKCMDDTVNNPPQNQSRVIYPDVIEDAIAIVQPVIEEQFGNKLNTRWLSLKLLDQDDSLIHEVNAYYECDCLENPVLKQALKRAQVLLKDNEIFNDQLKDIIVSSIVEKAQEIAKETVSFDQSSYDKKDRRLDRFFTSKWTGYPIMILLLALVFWITITGSNVPSTLLSNFLFGIEDKITDIFMYFNAPSWLHGFLVLGVYRVLAWVVSVMLPPMAIFFPLFTLLEDFGYLPRIAYNLDKPFKKCCACGKQALTMCMGFGCNAAGIIGCRIIDSPRERLLAIITNNFVPCNGRFPTLIAMISMFFIGSAGLSSSIISALLLTGIILVGIFFTFLSTKILSKTVLKGVPSSFTLELPPYRKPQIGKVIVRSIFDRTLFVLGRAIIIAIPAGALIWLMANITLGDISLLAHCSNALDPFARLIGLDGVILIAFILGFPANEIVIPIIIMAYLAQGSLIEFESLVEMKQLFVLNGWTWLTALNVMLFSLLHWPCSTTILTIKKETNSWKWTALSFLLPTLTGIIICFIVTQIGTLFL